MAILKRMIAWSVVDNCVPHGIAPQRGAGRSLFRWALKDRDLNIRVGHPLYEIVNRDPFNSTYALSRAAMAWLWHRLHRVRPQCILELGGGRSTGMFSLYARHEQEQGRTTPIVVSLDHDAQWIKHTAQLLRDLKTDHWVRLILAPISGRQKMELGYGIEPAALKEALDGRAVDFLLIDGPPGTVGRQNTLPLVLPFLGDNSDVFFDDAERDSESKVIAQWQREYADRMKSQGTLPFGLGLFWFRMQSSHQPDSRAQIPGGERSR